MTENTKMKIGEKTITIFELTVDDVRRWIADSAEKYAEGDIVRAALLDGVSLYDLARMTDLTLEDMDRMTPSQLQQVADQCRKVNSIFFGMCTRVTERLENPATAARH